MKFSIEWIRELANTKLKPAQLAELISVHTAEAELTETTSFKNIIVAEVVKVEKHPNADRLRVIELTDGTKTYAPVVCGAWNFDVGARVPLALPGATIPHDQHDPKGSSFVLGKATIRGVESQGMICSGKELGLSDDGKGIMLLDQSYDLGSELSVGEPVLDISSFANRPDLHSYIGVAREIAALSDSSLVLPPQANLPKPSNKLSVSIKNDKSCNHYSALKLSSIEIKPSPDFIQARLKASGLRPINNVVDITNYVMLLTGQPSHAFDANKVDSEIIIRNAESGEKIKTLDDVERSLTKDILVIADKSKPIAIAGIIGGKDSAVSDSTTEIILEVGNFNASAIRKASRNLGVRTDASARFEKSLPISFVEFGLSVATHLLKQYASATVETYTVSGKSSLKPITISATNAQINKLLGMEIPSSEQKSILENLGFKVTTGKTVKVIVPEWRPDVTTWEDLAEEIVRFKGLDDVPLTPPTSTFSAKYTDPIVDFTHKVSSILTQTGLHEIYSYSFSSNGDQSALEVEYPLNDEQKFLRTSLLPNMVKTAELNSRYFDKATYFEIGNIYRKGSGGFVETTKLAIIGFDKKKFPTEYVNGVVANLVDKLGCKLEFIQHADDAADILINGKSAGSVETIYHPDLKIVGLSLNLKLLMDLSRQKEFNPIGKFPSKTLDTSIIVDKNVTWSEILKVVGKNPLLKDIQSIDTYVGQGIPSGKKSLTVRMVYQADDKTLTESEVETANKEILSKITEKTGATIRN